MINFTEFFTLLANKQFPVATFIRSEEEFDYLQEPDIFHEIFGHCPLLTNPAFAHFTETYGKLGLAASKEDRVYLARLYWFTVEFVDPLDNTMKIFKAHFTLNLLLPNEPRSCVSKTSEKRLICTYESRDYDPGGD